MAPLISMLMEAAEVVGVTDTAGPAAADVALPASRSALNAAANWDLCTVAVFTCSRACQGGQQGSEGSEDQAVWVEAAAVIANEDECHIPMR